MIGPFQERLEEFKKLVKDSYQSESEQRISLKAQIEHSLKLNENLSLEAQKLTQALAGNHKLQGNWGELQLKTILELSGLSEGREYTLQVTGLRNDDNRLQIPDAIVHLPQNKSIVIDSKVSLGDYIELTYASDKQTSKAYSEKFLANIRRHIKELSAKDYENLAGLNSLDFVLMYIPIDAAYQHLIETYPSIVSESLGKSVVITSSASLVTCLRTIYFLWQQEQQSLNAQKIAEQGAKLYDKLVNFTHEFMDLGKSLEKAEKHYQDTFKKLSSGRGNLISQAENLKALGVSPKKQMPLSAPME